MATLGGCKSIADMLAHMPATELLYWEEVYRREFLGDERDDFRSAVVASTVANFAGRTLEDGVTKAPLDYMYFRETPQAKPKRKTRKQIAEQQLLTFAAFGERFKVRPPKAKRSTQPRRGRGK